MRVKGDADFFFFLTEIAGFGINPDPSGPRITEDQHELANWLQGIYEKKKAGKNAEWLHEILTPRDTLKSTVLQGFALWITVKEPDTRILFYGEVHEQAQKRLAVLKNVIASNKTFRDAYGELDGSTEGRPWNEDMIIVATRKNLAIREGTIETAGLDVVINSRHFDWVFPDDLHSEKNTKTREQIEDVYNKAKLLTPLLANDGHMIFAGVFWTDNDVYKRLIDDHHADTFRRSAFTDEFRTKPTYPITLPLEALRKKQEFTTVDVFSCQYLLDPTSASAQKFKKEWFTIIPDRDFESVKTFLLIDPAGDPTAEQAIKRDSDYVGIVAVGINSMYDVLIRQMFMDRLGPTEAIEVVISFILKYNLYIIGIEKTGLGNMRHYLTEELRKRKRYAILEDLEPHNRSKYARIIELEPLGRRHKIYIAAEANYKDEFFDQIRGITNGIKSKHDDLIDPLAYVLDLLKIYGIGVEMLERDPTSTYIPPEYRNLDPVSRDYWMSVQRSKEKIVRQNWRRSLSYENFGVCEACAVREKQIEYLKSQVERLAKEKEIERAEYKRTVDALLTVLHAPAVGQGSDEHRKPLDMQGLLGYMDEPGEDRMESRHPAEILTNKVGE
jgi:hypothetical protein